MATTCRAGEAGGQTASHGPGHQGRRKRHAVDRTARCAQRRAWPPRGPGRARRARSAGATLVPSAAGAAACTRAVPAGIQAGPYSVSALLGASLKADQALTQADSIWQQLHAGKNPPLAQRQPQNRRAVQRGQMWLTQHPSTGQTPCSAPHVCCRLSPTLCLRHWELARDQQALSGLTPNPPPDVPVCPAGEHDGPGHTTLAH